MIPAPAIVSIRLIALSSGKATSRAPICSGTAKLISPVRNGIAMKKIMMAPWVVNSWAKWLGFTRPGASTASACCERISTASTTARDSMTRAVTTYMMPIFLWSRLVSQSKTSGFHQRL